MLTEFWLEAIGFLVRCLHIVAAIAWIGESFYFVALDRGLKPSATPTPNLFGESWSVHGGGFYLKQKYLPAPAQLPNDLHWSMWKSYTTWISGFVLLSFLYLLQPSFYLIDLNIAQWSDAAAIALVLVYLIGGYIVYDLLCYLFGHNDRVLGIFITVMVALLAFLMTHTFSGRAAFLLTGAVLGSIMSANVFFVIIPGQRRTVAALQRGKVPNPSDGARGKQRSVHNTYFTLPVVFAMVSTHYAPAFAHSYSWIVLLLFMLAGVLIRQFFVLWHSGARAWRLLLGAAVITIGTLAWLAPNKNEIIRTSSEVNVDINSSNETSQIKSSPINSDIDVIALEKNLRPTTNDLQSVFQKHCVVCHSASPKLIASAPKGVMYDNPAQIEIYADKIHQQVVVLKVMPPGNITAISEIERAAIARWFANR